MKKNEYAEYVIEDLLSDFEGASYRAMFGGYGVYVPDEEFGKIMCGVITEDQFYLRLDGDTCEVLVDAGGEQFIHHGYTSHKKPAAMPWWSAPESVLEDKEKFLDLVNTACEIVRSKKKVDK